MDRLQAMSAFVRVVESGTFTKAADSMDLPKATVTRLVQSLETHLRTQLLNRTTRRVTVTPDGAAYYERATRLLSDIDEIEGAMTQARKTPRGRIRVDVPGTFGRMVLVPALGLFQDRYPEIQIDLGVSDRAVDLVADHVDCVVRGGAITDLSLVARCIIGDLNYRVCAAPGYLRRHGTPRDPAELEAEPFAVISYFSARTGRPVPFVLSRSIAGESEDREVYGRSTLAVNDGGAYLAAALAGLGVVRAPSFMVAEHLDAGRLVPLFPDWRAAPMPLHIAYPPNRHLSHRLRVFVDWVAELVAQDVNFSSIR
jgi:LysR family transcriptional regulator, regulator for bpeEF and oprC